MRSCLKSAAPGETILMNIQIINQAGAQKTDVTMTQATSSARFHDGTRLRPGATLERPTKLS
jgi:hypothetical protein